MSDVKLPTDFTVDERKAAWGLIYELFDMAPIDPTDQWKLAALLLRARALPQAWVCAKCGAGSVEHGMPNHPANQCVYEPTLITVPGALTPKQEAADELVRVLDGITLDGFGIFDDPRGQRWRLSLPVTPEESSTASIASKRTQIESALAKAGRP